MKKGFVVGGIDSGADDFQPLLASPIFYKNGGSAGGKGAPRNIAHRAGNHGHVMPARREQARKLIMARPAGFVERSEGLMNDQDVHVYFGKMNPLVNVKDLIAVTSTASDNAGTFVP